LANTTTKQQRKTCTCSDVGGFSADGTSFCFRSKLGFIRNSLVDVKLNLLARL